MIDPLDYIEWAKLVAKRYKNRGLDLDECISAAFVGLLKACTGFDPTKGIRFEYYCEWWIRREISLDIVMNRTIKIPRIRFYEAKAYLKGRSTKKLSVSQKELLVDAVYVLGLLRQGYENQMEEIIDSFDPQSASYDRTLQTLSHISPLQSEIIQLKLGLDGREEMSFGAIGKALEMNSGSIYYHYKKGIKCVKEIYSKSIPS